MYTILHGFTVCFGIILLLIAGSAATPSEDQLLSRQFANYETSSRPVQHNNETVNVSLMIAIKRLVDVNEKEEVLRTQLILNFRWHDYRLAWNPNEYDGLKRILVAPSRIWVPDVIMENSADLSIDSRYPVNAGVMSSGEVTWDPVGHFHSICLINTFWFPYDEQRCDMDFMSWGYDHTQVNILTEPSINFDVYVKNGEWNIIEAPITRILQKYDGFEHPFVIVRATLVLRRVSAWYLFNMVLPVAILSLLGTTTFCLPTAAGDKLGLASSILMSVIFYWMMISAQVPETTGTIPIIAYYLTAVIGLLAFSVAVSVLILNLYNRSNNDQPMPAKMQKVCRMCCRLLRIQTHRITNGEEKHQNNGETDKCLGTVELEQEESLPSKRNKNNNKSKSDNYSKIAVNDWILAATVVDKFSCYSFVIVTIIMTIVIFSF